MRLKKLHLKAFGPFTERTLDFDGDGPGLHIIHGSNEAGKSSSLRGLKAFLFGFPERTPDNFVHANKNLLVGGVIAGNDGEDLTLYRRKKRIGDLIDADGNQINHDVINSLMPGIGAELFSSLYGIDHQALVAGGEDILAQKGEVGKALFSAGTGITELSGVLDGLDAESLELFKPRGSNQLLNQAIGRYNELKKQVRNQSLLPSKWREHHARKIELETEYKELEKEVQSTSYELQRLKRLQSIIPELADLKHLHERLVELEGVVVLGPDFAERTKDLRHRIDALSRQLERDTKRLENLQQRREQIHLNQTVLDNGKSIEDLYQRLGRYRKDRNDRIRLQGERAAHRRDAGNLLHAIKPDLSLDEIDTLRPIYNRKRSIQTLSSRHEALKEHLVRAASDHEKAIKDLETVEKELAEYVRPIEVHRLAELIRRVHQAGNLDQQISDVALEVKTGEQNCLAQLKRIGLWTGALQELLSATLPLTETLRQYRDESHELKQKRERIERDNERLTQELQSIQKQCQQIVEQADVVTEDDLEHIRNIRQQGWDLIKRQWLEGEVIGDELDRYCPGRSLHEAYESHVGKADILVDQLRRDAELTASIDTSKRQMIELEQHLEKHAGMLNDCNAAETDFAARWHNVWQVAGIVPLSPTEMLEWLEEVERLRMRAEAIFDNRGKNIERVKTRRNLYHDLREELSGLGQSVPEEGDEIAPLLHSAETTLEKLEKNNNSWRTLAEKKVRLENETADSAGEKQGASEAVDAWQCEWDNALSQLIAEAPPAPEEALDLLDMLDGCLKKLADAQGFQSRIEGIERDVEQFLGDVKVVRENVSVVIDDKEPDQVVLRLHDILILARQDKETVNQLTKDISGITIELEDTAGQLTQIKTGMESCLREAQCENVADLDQIIERSVHYRDLTDKISAVQSAVIKISGSTDIDQIRMQAEAENLDELPGKIAALERRLNEDLTPRTNDLLKLIGEEKRELKLMDGRSRAAEVAELMQQEAAEIQRLISRYGTVKLAALILQKEIERYREEHQDPILKRASSLFARLTLGSFTGLRTDIDDRSNPVLTGVRPDGSTITVDGMSDGTCDQLYLALRLATLEYRLEGGEPVPFIVDDILVNFDDDRSRASLEVLADIAAKNQVLLFTHHNRIVEQAEQLRTGTEIVIHEL